MAENQDIPTCTPSDGTEHGGTSSSGAVHPPPAPDVWTSERIAEIEARCKAVPHMRIVETVADLHRRCVRVYTEHGTKMETAMLGSLLTTAPQDIAYLLDAIASLRSRVAAGEKLRCDVDHAISRLAQHANVLICSDVASHLHAALAAFEETK